MKKTLLGLSLLLLPNIIFACPSLEGEWQSSKAKFIAFNTKWANVESKAWNFMSQTQGLEVIKYTSNGQIIISTPEYELTMGNKVFKKKSDSRKVEF